MTQKEQDVGRLANREKVQPGTWFVFEKVLLEAQVLEMEDGSLSVCLFIIREFLRFVRCQIAAAALHDREIRKSGEIPDGILQRIGVCQRLRQALLLTPELKKKLARTAFVLGMILHVGLGTFRPVSVEKIEEHIMHSEHYEMPKETAI
ncbi:MAG: S-adenosylmethionine:tRNA ribosyltransferase-isomerase [Acutalibacteraceae bacterium]